jgi:uncharacterized membrane protein
MRNSSAAGLEYAGKVISFFRLLVRLLLAALFLFAGTVHLADPAIFLPIMPPWVPFHRLCVEVSGVFELLGGMGILIPQRRIQALAGWGLALLLVAVFPANIYMAAANIRVHGLPAHPWISWARLPLQPILIVAVLWVTESWPGKCSKQAT